MLSAFPSHSNMSMISSGKCSLVRYKGANVSSDCIYVSCSLKDWLNRCSCEMPAHCCACWSLVICSANLFASCAIGKNLCGWLMTIPSRVWTGDCTYPSKVSVPSISCMGGQLFGFVAFVLELSQGWGELVVLQLAKMLTCSVGLSELVKFLVCNPSGGLHLHSLL